MDLNEPTKVSQRPSWLTNEYITEVLRKGENNPEIVITNIDFNIPLGKGENYNSIIHKVTVTYADGRGHQEKKMLIMKVAPQNKVMQHFHKESGLFEQEIRAYSIHSILFPAMARLTGKPIVTPKFYPTEREDMLILEDMSSRGFKMADRTKRLDLAHSILVMKTLARFHGLSFAVVEREPNIIANFPETLFSSRVTEMNSHLFSSMFNPLASLVESWNGFERFGEKIRGRLDGILDKVKEELISEADVFMVINHGDCWVNNMLFQYNEITEEPEEVCFLDLQIVRYGSPALDLQYLFAISFADGIRGKYEDVLLEVYHQTLLETLKSVAQKHLKYTLEDLRHDFQRKASFGFDMGCLFIGAVVADSSEAFDIESLTEEVMKVSSANPMEKMIHGKRFKDVFQKFLLYYEKKNVFNK